MEEDYARSGAFSPKSLTAAEQEQIRSLAGDLPALRQATGDDEQARPATDHPACWVEQVVVTVAEARVNEPSVPIHWAGGQISQHARWWRPIRMLPTEERLCSNNKSDQ